MKSTSFNRARWLLIVPLLAMFYSTPSWGKDYTITFSKNTKGNSDYTKSVSISSDNVTWTCFGNNQADDALRVGGKNTTATDRTITSGQISIYVSKFTINHSGTGNGKNSSITISSIKLEVSSKNDFTNSDVITKTSPSVSDAGDIVFTPTSATQWAKNSYYRVTINYKITGSNNCYLSIKSISLTESTTATTPYKVTYSYDASYGAPTRGGSTVTSETVSSISELPTIANKADCDWKFAGWSTTNTSLTALSLISTPYAVTSAQTLYAVYKKTEGGGGGTYTLDYSNESSLSSSSSWGSYGTALEYTASDGSKWTVKAYKSSGMQINTGKNASIKIPDCPSNISSIEITGSTEKAVGLSASDYTGSGTITYIVEGTDATSQTLDCSDKTVTGGYIVPKSGSTSITKIVVTYGGGTTTYSSSPDCTPPCQTLGQINGSFI